MSRIGRKRTRPLMLRNFEAEAVGAGVAETVALSRARGQAIIEPAERRGP